MNFFSRLFVSFVAICGFVSGAYAAVTPAQLGVQSVMIQIADADPDPFNTVQEQVVWIFYDDTSTGACTSSPGGYIQASKFRFKANASGLSDEDAQRALDTLISFAVSAKLSGSKLNMLVNTSTCEATSMFALE